MTRSASANAMALRRREAESLPEPTVPLNPNILSAVRPTSGAPQAPMAPCRMCCQKRDGNSHAVSTHNKMPSCLPQYSSCLEASIKSIDRASQVLWHQVCKKCRIVAGAPTARGKIDVSLFVVHGTLIISNVLGVETRRLFADGSIYEEVAAPSPNECTSQAIP